MIQRDHEALALAVGMVVMNAGSAEGKAGELLLLHGWTLQRLADRYDCTAETVREALQRVRVTMRKSWERGQVGDKLIL